MLVVDNGLGLERRSCEGEDGACAEFGFQSLRGSIEFLFRPHRRDNNKVVLRGHQRHGTVIGIAPLGVSAIHLEVAVIGSLRECLVERLLSLPDWDD